MCLWTTRAGWVETVRCIAESRHQQAVSAVPARFVHRGRGKAFLMTTDREHDQPTGFPEPSGGDPDDRDPHHVLNNPVDEPDPTEWPDPYDRRDDPRDPSRADAYPYGDEPHPSTGSQSTSEPNPKQDPEAQPWAEAPKRDKLDQ